jgi:ribonuclease HII
MAVPDPDLELERQLMAEGARTVAGLDEVGRGAWAGPVSVGVVLLDRSCGPAPAGIRDSKLLSATRRRVLEPEIRRWSLGAAVGSATHAECDQLGMRGAVALACSRALDELEVIPDAVIVDGPLDLLAGGSEGFVDLVASHRWRQTPPRVEPVIKADQRCLSVAAASVVAKVARDAEMRSLAESFPAFDFHSNVGYPAPVHRRALLGYGLTSIHRRSWSYVDDLPLGAGPQ